MGQGVFRVTILLKQIVGGNRSREEDEVVKGLGHPGYL